jgi:quinol monooxygenase YgiN
MLIVHVFFKVKPEQVTVFQEIARENAHNSRKEPGVISFEVLQQQDDATKFLFAEIYRTPDDQIKHRETSHYQKWRAAVAAMLVEPYTFIKYDNAFPE